MPTPLECFKSAIARWEGEWQSNPADVGNYFDGRLIGTMRGVTPGAFADFFRLNPVEVTAERMKREVTLDVAAAIGVKNYFDRPGFNRLLWCPLVEIAADIGWGSGPVMGVKSIQRLIGVNADGVIGPETVSRFEAYVKPMTGAEMRRAIIALTQGRADFYIRISEPGTPNYQFRSGWLRRANWYLPTNPEWWNTWSKEEAGANRLVTPASPDVLDVTYRPITPPVPPAPVSPAPSLSFFRRIIRAFFS